MYVRDFNSHNIFWKYDENDTNEEDLQEWMYTHNLELVFSPKDKGTFHSARWRKDYTPDLGLVTRASLNDNTMCTRKVLEDFPSSQHRPVILDYGLQIPLVRSIPKLHWNFKLAD